MAELPSTLPATLVRGDSLRMRFEFPGYSPDDGWGVAVPLVGPVNTDLSVSVDGQGWIVTLSAGSSLEDILPGRYAWSVQLENPNTDERVTVLSGFMQVSEDPGNLQPPIEQRSFARRALEALETALLGRSGDTLTSFAIDGRSYTFASHADLMAYRMRLRQEIADEDAAAAAERGESAGRVAWVQF